MATSEQAHVRMRIIEPGQIPPSGGPLRENYLDHHGRESLKVSVAEYSECLSLLGEHLHQMPALHQPLVEEDDSVRQEIQRAKRTEWAEFTATLDLAIVAAIKPHISNSVAAAVDALNYLEDHELMEEAHIAIHRAAFLKRGIVGCGITFRDGQFWTACPIRISHLRIGVSPALVSDFECSICLELVEDCDHQMGVTYSVIASRDDTGLCKACTAAACEHLEGQTYALEAFARARNIKVTEVSFVARPRYPRSRVVELVQDLGASRSDPRIRKAAEHGHLNCDADLGPCKGFTEMSDRLDGDFSPSDIQSGLT